MDDVTALRDALLDAYIGGRVSVTEFTRQLDALIAAAEARAALTPEKVEGIRQTYLEYNEQMDKGVNAVCDAILAVLATDEAVP